MAKRTRIIFFGFSTAKRHDGTSSGHAALTYRPKNAYELLGLRKPAVSGLGKA